MQGRGSGILLSVFVAGALGLPTSGLAQGFGVYEQGACAMGRGGAAVADPCDDGSAVFFNPAALSFEPGLDVSIGGSLLIPSTEFAPEDQGLVTDGDDDAVPVPHGYVRYGVDDRLAVAFGAYAPYGLATKWPTDFRGAFVGFDNELQTIYLQPSVSYRVHDRVSIGGGPVVVVSNVELSRRLDLSRQPVPPDLGAPTGTTFADLGIPTGTPFAASELEKEAATGFAGHVGIAVEASDRVRLGARWLTSSTVEYEDGEVEFEPVPTGLTLPPNNPFGVPGGTSLDDVLAQARLFADGGPLADGGVSTEIEMPDQVVVGVSVEATERLTLMGDWQWTNWSTFDRVPIEFENPATPDEELVESFEDTNGIRLGGQYAFGEGVTIRGGYVYNEGASPPEAVTPILFEAARNQLTAGATFPVGESATVDVGYIFVTQDDRRGRVTSPPPGQDPTVALNSGEFSLDAHLVGVDLRLRF